MDLPVTTTTVIEMEDDGTGVLGIAGSYLGFDSAGSLYATTGYGATLSKYDVLAGSKICDVAFGGIGKFQVNGVDDLYLLDTNWSDYYSTVNHVIPEPISIVLLALGGLFIKARRK